MIRKAWRTIVRFLRSARLAIWLLAIVGAWSMLATVVPQGTASNAGVAAWASAHSVVEPAVRMIGLHQAFTSPLFIASILALALSTGLCAWERTKVAMGRTRTLRQAALADERWLTGSHDLEISCDPALSGAEVLSIASDTLDRLGIKTKRREDLLAAVSHPWSVWGSPLFHWALLALIAALIVGNLLRSEGLMGVAVGQTSPDAPASYGILHSGPLRDWRRVNRSIRVDAFEPDFKTGGIDRGPTPTVAVLDAAGKVVKTQRVYPNMTLKTGSLTIYPDNWGLSANLTVLSPGGIAVGHVFDLVDFSATATGGTAPTQLLTISSGAGKAPLTISVTVPLDRKAAALVKAIPEKPMARVVVASTDGQLVLDRIVRPGEEVALPTGLVLRLDDIGYYARLSVVDDWSIPLLYAGLVAALAALTITVVTRQQIVLGTVIEGSDGLKLAVRVRLWRNASTSRSEIENELSEALSQVGKGSTT